MLLSMDHSQAYTCHHRVDMSFNSEISEEDYDCDREAMQNHVLRIVGV